MATGLVFLTNRSGEVEQSHRFRSDGDANNFIEKWKKLYAKGWKNISVVYEYDKPELKQNTKSRFKKGSMIGTTKLKRYNGRIKYGDMDCR